LVPTETVVGFDYAAACCPPYTARRSLNPGERAAGRGV